MTYTPREPATDDEVATVLDQIVAATTGWKKDGSEWAEWHRRMTGLPMATAGSLAVAATILVDSWTGDSHPGFGMFVQAHQAAIRKEMDAPLHSAPPPEHGIVTDPARRLILAYAAYVLMPDATWRAGQGQPAEHDHSGHGAAIVEIPEGAHTRRRTMGQARCPRCGEDELQRLWTCAVIAAEARYAAGTLHRDTPVEMASFVRPMPPIPEVTQDDIDAARVALIEAEPAAALSPLEQLAAQTRGPRPSAVW